MRTTRCVHRVRAVVLLAGLAPLVSVLVASGGVSGASVRAAPACTGAWTVDAQPSAELNGVRADARGVWVTGSSGGTGLLLRRGGGRWAPTRFPSVTAMADIASDGHSTWAVGVRSGKSNLGGDYVFRKNGQRWVRVRVPGLPATKLGLGFTAVAVKDGDVWLAGTWAYEGKTTDQVIDPGGSGWLTARRHAGRWRTYAGNYSAYAELYAITALGTRDAWAVGHQGPTIVSAQEVMLHWNGSKWVDMSHYDYVYGLDAVLAVAPADAWAVGTPNLDRPDYSPHRPAIEHWNGKHWTRVSMPAWHWPIAPDLTALAAFGRRDVWAGGVRFNGAPALLHWDGSQWREAAAPPVKTGILGLAAAPDGTLWAAGTHFVAHARCG